MTRRFGRACGLVVLAVGLFVVPAGIVCTSQKVDLGTLGGNESIASAMNAAEQVVGGAETAGGQWHAFLWEAGTMTDLGTLGGDDSEAHDISQTVPLMIVGTSEMPDPNDPNLTVERAFLWQSDAMTDVGTLGGGSSEAWGVSNTGSVVGSAQTADEDWRAFLWQNDVMTDLGTLGENPSCALGINNAGRVVGWSMAPSVPDDPNDPPLLPVRRAFLWTAQNGMQDLGTLGGPESTAYAINDEGYVVGWSHTADGERHVCLWDPNGVQQDLGTLGGPIAEAWGIGPTALGGYGLDANGTHQAMWGSADGQLWHVRQPLGGQGAVFVYDVENGFRTVGSAPTAGGDQHAFLRHDPRLSGELP